jgi:PAP2 superfamily
MVYVQESQLGFSLSGAVAAYFSRARQLGCAPDVIIRRNRIYLFVYLMILGIAPTFYLANFDINFEQLFTLFGLVVFSQLVSAYYAARHKDALISNLFAGTFQTVVLALTSLLYSYVAMRMNFPLVDGLFDSIDKSLGFDWFAYKNFVISSYWIKFASLVCYGALEIQVVVACLVCMVFLKFREYQIFLIAFAASSMTVCIVAAFLPAYATYYFYDVVDEMAHHFSIKSGYGHIGLLDQIRSGAPFNPSDNMFGLIAFPSFHACGATLFIWLFWQVPFLRWLLVPLNIGMIAATPIVGGHYLVDVIGGVVLGIVVIAITRHVVLKKVQPHS